MRTVEWIRLLVVFIGCLSYTFALSLLRAEPRLPEWLISILVVLLLLGIPWLGYYFVGLRTPILRGASAFQRHAIAALGALAPLAQGSLRLIFVARGLRWARHGKQTRRRFGGWFRWIDLLP